MAGRFPHLADTSYPHLDNVEPYRRKVDFDYGRYDYEATAKLCNVTWPYDYSHVVNWHSARGRDAYFASIPGRSIELGQGFVRTQLDNLVVPVPYDVALTYGYVYMQVPTLTEDDPIDYETAQGLRTVCAFIADVVYQAPSSTLLVLDVDVWTTYLPHLSVNSLMLTRGHAPMWRTDADKFLSNPIRNCADLLTPDVDFGGSDVVRAGEVMPLSTAEPILVLASTIPYTRIEALPTATTGSSTPPTYYDIAARNGEQVGVEGFVWAPGGKSYEGQISPSTPTHFDNDMPMGLFYYGLMGSDVVAGALSTLFSALPVFAASIQSAYLVPSDLVNATGTLEVAGLTLHTVYSYGAFQDLGSFELTKDAFGYAQKYADIAKLYTSPYAHVTVSDDAGASIDVRVEDTTGSITAAQLISATWPMLTWDVALTDVANRGGSARYTWMRITGESYERRSTNADIAAMLISFDFPTYALYLDAQTEAALKGQARTDRARHDAVVAYQSTMRSANTSEHNTYDSDATAKTNADASADTAKANADASADMSKTNTDASADTAKGNVSRTTSNMTTNAAVQNSYRSTDRANAGTYTSNTASYDVAFVSGSTFVAQQNNQVAAVAGITNALTQTGGSVAGSLIAGDPMGALLAGANGAAGAIVAGAAYPVTVSTEATLAALSQNSILNKAIESSVLAYINASNANDQNSDITANNVATADGNATDTQTTTKANATRTQTTSKDNASRTQATSKANALRSQGTSDSNANHTRDTTEQNAKAALENAQSDYLDNMRALAYEGPNAHGEYSGSGIHEHMRNRGLHFRVVTQDDSAIARAGDAFRRYGYRYDGMWEVSDWCPSGHDYCYWQSSDIIQDTTVCPNVGASRTIRAMLEHGITVWASPERIGRWQ